MSSFTGSDLTHMSEHFYGYGHGEPLSFARGGNDVQRTEEHVKGGPRRN
jgi:hypothetical protein